MLPHFNRIKQNHHSALRRITQIRTTMSHCIISASGFFGHKQLIQELARLRKQRFYGKAMKGRLKSTGGWGWKLGQVSPREPLEPLVAQANTQNHEGTAQGVEKLWVLGQSHVSCPQKAGKGRMIDSPRVNHLNSQWFCSFSAQAGIISHTLQTLVHSALRATLHG